MRVLSLAWVALSMACGVGHYDAPPPGYPPPAGHGLLGYEAGGDVTGPESVSLTRGAETESDSAVANVVGNAVDLIAAAVGEDERSTEPPRARGQVQRRGPMMVIEADVGLAVDELEEAADKIRELTASLQGIVVGDEVLREAQRATFVLRLPPDKVEVLLEELEKIATIRHRRISARDVSRQYHDNAIRLDNLTKELARFQALLDEAKAVKDMLEIERELNRVRGQIEQIKGELRYLKDKVAMATVTVSVTLKDTDVAFAPKAKFQPGLRYGLLGLYEKGEPSRGFYGPGFSLHVRRFWSLEVDLLSDNDRDPFRADAIVATVSGAAYSDFLGRGKRTFLNPYFGYALGYARADADDNFAIGGSLGVELLKTETVLVDANARALGLFGEGSPQLAAQATLTVNVAF